MDIRRFPPTVAFDWVIENLLRDPANFDILENFLSTLLREGIRVVAVVDSETNRHDLLGKVNQLNLAVQDVNANSFFINLQTIYGPLALSKLLYGAGRLLLEDLNVAKKFSQTKKVVSVALLYFLPHTELEKGDDYVYQGKTEFYGFTTGSHVKMHSRYRSSDGIAVRNGISILPEYYLIAVEAVPETPKNPLDEWVYFFKNTNIPETFQAPGIQMAREKLDVRKLDEKERRAYERFLLDRASYRDEILSAGKVGEESAWRDKPWPPTTAI